ncbi:MAG: ABC transporter transmembrane domain-containing protein, partial [Acidimicrobiales bacterium]
MRVDTEEGSTLTAPTHDHTDDGSDGTLVADASATSDGRTGWRLLWESIKEERVGILLGMLASLGWTAGRVAVPFLVQLGVDRGIRGDEPLLRWSLLIVVAGLISSVFLGIRRYIAFRNARLIEARLRDRIFAHIQRLHFSFHDATATGELMSRGNTDL